ncbi:MAG: PQQ-binding-like beta-propeller repeat protein [Coriobacteriia bacterium]|nr:PQQ-binding-like beta-propeller repeat protein [Coriobacteriia bacterium]
MNGKMTSSTPQRKTLRGYALCMLALLVVLVAPAYSTADGASSSWPNWRGSADNNGLIHALTPRVASDAALLWQTDITGLVKTENDYKPVDAWASPSSSQPIIVNGNIAIVSGNKVLLLDSKGAKVAEGTLDNPIGYMSRPVYADGLIIVPTSDGVVEAVYADTLKRAWVTLPIPGQQLTCTLNAVGGYVYVGMADTGWAVPSANGYFKCLEVSTGKVVWEKKNDNAGYYWAGAVVTHGAAIYAGDDGILTSVDAASGAQVDTMSVGSPVRSTIIKSPTDSSIYFTTHDGNLYKVAVNTDGSFGASQSVNFCKTSTGAPTISNGKIYAAGLADKGSGVLSVVDSETMQVEQSFAAPGNIQSAPLVTDAYGNDRFVYYTSNITPGALYVSRLGESSSAAQVLYTPAKDMQNYCEFSPIAGTDGTLYYVNDSGYLFAVGNRNKTPPPLSISMATISASKYIYTGSVIAPKVTVRNGDTTLKKDTDYTLAYASNKNTGKATVTVTGIIHYKGTVKLTFKIIPRKLAAPTLKEG